MGKRQVPDLADATEFSIPACAERTLDNGLTILAIHRPSVPLVEVRLRVPFARADVAVSSLMSQTLLSGTADKSMVDIAAQLQTVGGALSASVDADRFLLAGNGLVDGLPTILATMAEVLDGATYPDDQVEVERERIVDRLNVARQQPAHLVQQRLLKRMYGEHSYAVQTPEPEAVAPLTAVQLREMHADRLHARGATLVIVGDLPVEKALDAGEAALSEWAGGAEPITLDSVPALRTGPLSFVDRPDSVQSSLRVALTALPRTHEDNAAQQLANLIYGGYFSSRMVANIREDKGYSYSPRSAIDHGLAGSSIVISAEVATEVTGPAMWEVWYELGRIASTEPTETELEQARRYALGTLRLGTETQAGLASLASSFAGQGLRPDWLLEHATRLAKVTVADVQRVASRIMAPSKAVAVVLGDARHAKPALEVLSAVDEQ